MEQVRVCVDERIVGDRDCVYNWFSVGSLVGRFDDCILG